jgi:SAM-dependent methyltransferase
LQPVSRRVFRRLARQFGRPTGALGRLAGWIMAHRASNLARNRWTVELLDVQPADWVLEIGFGPGVALGWLAERARQGFVVGLEHSPLMLAAAARRNEEAIRAGRMTLQLAALDAAPDLGTGFDAIMAVNVAMFWSEPALQLRELRERLRPGGRIALTVQPRQPGATDVHAARAGEALARHLREAGFRDVRVERLPLRPVAAVCALGVR